MIDILMPVFKPRFIEAAIRSVMRQSVDDWKLTMLVDKQDKELLRTCKKYEGSKISVFNSKRNKGDGRAKRWLIDHTSEDYFFLVDDDDLLTRNAIEVFEKSRKLYPEATLIRGRFRAVDAAGRYIKIPERNYIYRARSMYKGLTVEPLIVGQPYLIKREAYNKTNGWEGVDVRQGANIIKGQGGDIDIFLQLEEIGPIRLIKDVLYLKRVHPGNLLRTIHIASRRRLLKVIMDRMIKRRNIPLTREEYEHVRVQFLSWYKKGLCRL